MLVLDVAENLLDQILEGHEPGSAAKLVDHHSHRAFLGEQAAHHRIGQEGLGGIEHLLDVLLPVGRRVEQLGDMDISYHIVYISAIDQYLAAARRGEEVRELLTGGLVDVDSHKLIAGSHAVAQLGRREIECVVEDLHLISRSSILVSR